MLVKSVFMELRSRLRSCNVYITTNVDFKKDCNLKISIQSDCIVLNYYDNNGLKRYDSLSSIESLSDCSDEESDVTCVIPIQEFCSIIPNSMSCLKIERNTVSFRILTDPKNGGNFYTEIISPNNLSKEIKVDKLEVNFSCKQDLKIVCGNCSNVISNSFVKFDRILELPTSNLDMSEWFCHGHSHDKPSQSEILKPNSVDFLYRLTFFVVNHTILSEKANKFNSQRMIYHCNRCLAWLGVKNKDTVKLYNSDVKINHSLNTKHIFAHKNPTDDVTVDDFVYTVECLTREFNLGLQYTMMCKIVLECNISASRKQYLLIWVMDKELQVLRNEGNCIKSDRVILKSSFLTKILYKMEVELNDEVESWLADPSAVSSDISKTMFNRGLNHLEKMSQKVPELFRYTNGYTVSYLNA